METAPCVPCKSESREESKPVIGGAKKGGVACYWLPSGKCMISPPTGMAGEAGMGGVDVCENNDR